jgi:hypothetical protein
MCTKRFSFSMPARSAGSPREYRLRAVVDWTTHILQSAGTLSIPHTLPGSSITSPSSHNFSCFPRLIQLVTLAVTGFEIGSPCNRIGVPASTGREIRAVHPFGLTRITRHDSENGQSGSRLTAVIGMSQQTRVPQRAFTFVEIEFLVEIWYEHNDSKHSCGWAILHLSVRNL